MKTVKYTNGYVGQWDDTIVPGDLITTYYKGYFEFVLSESRPDMVPLFHFTQRYTKDGIPKKGKKVLCCDAAYCKHAKDSIANQIEQLQTTIDRLKIII